MLKVYNRKLDSLDRQLEPMDFHGVWLTTDKNSPLALASVDYNGQHHQILDWRDRDVWVKNADGKPLYLFTSDITGLDFKFIGPYEQYWNNDPDFAWGGLNQKHHSQNIVDCFDDYFFPQYLNYFRVGILDNQPNKLAIVDQEDQLVARNLADFMQNDSVIEAINDKQASSDFDVAENFCDYMNDRVKELDAKEILA